MMNYNLLQFIIEPFVPLFFTTCGNCITNILADGNHFERVKVIMKNYKRHVAKFSISKFCYLKTQVS